MICAPSCAAPRPAGHPNPILRHFGRIAAPPPARRFRSCVKRLRGALPSLVGAPWATCVPRTPDGAMEVPPVPRPGQLRIAVLRDCDGRFSRQVFDRYRRDAPEDEESLTAMNVPGSVLRRSAQGAEQLLGCYPPVASLRYRCFAQPFMGAGLAQHAGTIDQIRCIRERFSPGIDGLPCIRSLPHGSARAPSPG